MISQKFFENLQLGKIDEVLQLLTDDFTWTVAGKPNGGFKFSGIYNKQEFLQMLGNVGSIFP